MPKLPPTSTYLAELEGTLAQVHQKLAADGLSPHGADHSGAGVILDEDARYAHVESYLREAARRSGLSIAVLITASVNIAAARLPDAFAGDGAVRMGGKGADRCCALSRAAT